MANTPCGSGIIESDSMKAAAWHSWKGCGIRRAAWRFRAGWPARSSAQHPPPRGTARSACRFPAGPPQSSTSVPLPRRDKLSSPPPPPGSRALSHYPFSAASLTDRDNVRPFLPSRNLDLAVGHGKKRVVRPYADIASGIPFGAALANDDVAGQHVLAADFLTPRRLLCESRPLRRAAGLFVSHDGASFLFRLRRLRPVHLGPRRLAGHQLARRIHHSSRQCVLHFKAVSMVGISPG